jgi:phospholipid/cholesterol/gamma-HCH transport system substrate-binding protein
MTARRIIGAVGVIALVVAAVLAVTRFADRGGANGYLVRAVFQNSSFVTPGEQVKVAGVTVGTIHAVQLTASNQAAVVLSISNHRFIPFRADAHCDIGLESLLGEQFVQCVPTQARSTGAGAPAPLALIHSGAGKGEHLLPVSGTTTPVGFDLLLDMNRLPLLERLRLLVSGLGVGLDANGHELNTALQRSNPALEQTDRVIRVLANQDRVIARLTDESSRILAPLSAQRAHLGGFLNHAGEVAATSASEGRAIEANLADLPAFLRQLRPAARRLTRLASEGTPALAQLNAHATEIDTAVSKLGPLAKQATPALVSLGVVADRARTVFPQSHTAAKDLLALATPLQPVARDIAAIASSFDKSGGIEDVMRFIYFYTGAVNGEDSLGHYVRTLLQIGSCSPRSPSPVPGCQATFNALSTGGSSDALRSTSGQSLHSTGSGSVVADALRAVGSDRTLTAVKPLESYLFGR